MVALRWVIAGFIVLNALSGVLLALRAVAKRAGVGQGSLYRHFPDRTSLAVAVFEDNLRDLEEHMAPPDRTIDDLLDRVVDLAVVSAALIELVTADLSDRRVAPLGARFQALVERLLVRDRAHGRVGSHIDAEDITLATDMLASELARTDPAQRSSVARRARALFAAAFAPR